jgi:hypothetical protein
LSKWKKRKYLLLINLSGCQGITDIGLSALGAGCRMLQVIDLGGCQGITEIGLSALARGCGKLEKRIRNIFCSLPWLPAIVPIAQIINQIANTRKDKTILLQKFLDH